MAINTDSIVSNIYSGYIAAATGSAATVKNTGYGKTIGDAKLSDEAASYYEELKKKYSNMDFVLVSSDEKDNAQANAASYANSGKLVVLIDEEKIERMATDETYRAQYEAIIANAASGLSQLQSSIESAGLSSSVSGYGMKVNDGGTSSFFAVLKKSSEDQKAGIEKKAEEKKAEKKAEEKKAKKKEEEERLEKSRESDKSDKSDADTVVITANSVEELMQKISDYTMAQRSDSVMTEEEKMVGQNIDIKG